VSVAVSSEAGAETRNGFSAYLFTHAAWFLAFGVQMVLFPYLVRVVLHEGPIQLGIAQMSLQLPTTLLILIGGFVADRADGRRIVILGCVASAATFLVLAGLVASGQLTFGLLIGYALVVGVIGAFAGPARDSLLSLVAPVQGGVQKAVSGASLAQFGGQILGMLAAMTAPLIGVAGLLAGQALMMGAATVAALRIRPRPAARRVGGDPFGSVGREIAEGFAATAASPVLGPVVLCSIGMGVCFMGAFAVLLPLTVQSYFPLTAGGGENTAIATALGAFSLCFWVGSMASAMVLMRRGAPRRKGRAYLLSLASGAAVLLVCSIPMPLWLLCVFNFVWGLGGGVAMTLGRGLVQEHAPEAARARVLSIFTLGLMGGGPIGAVAYGMLAEAVGPRPALLAPAILMMLIVGTVAARSRLAQAV
jgi:MFS family permease